MHFSTKQSGDGVVPMQDGDNLAVGLGRKVVILAVDFRQEVVVVQESHGQIFVIFAIEIDMFELAAVVEELGPYVVCRHSGALEAAVAAIEEVLGIGMLAAIVDAVHLVPVPVPVLLDVASRIVVQVIVLIMTLFSIDCIDAVLFVEHAFAFGARGKKQDDGGKG